MKEPIIGKELAEFWYDILDEAHPNIFETN